MKIHKTFLYTATLVLLSGTAMATDAARNTDSDMSGDPTATTKMQSSMSGNSGTTGTVTDERGTLDFTALDLDRNGSLSEKEFNPNGAYDSTTFGSVDTNRDGVINSTELSAWTSSQATPASR